MPVRSGHPCSTIAAVPQRCDMAIFITDTACLPIALRIKCLIPYSSIHIICCMLCHIAPYGHRVACRDHVCLFINCMVIILIIFSFYVMSLIPVDDTPIGFCYAVYSATRSLPGSQDSTDDWSDVSFFYLDVLSSGATSGYSATDLVPCER